MPTHQLKKWYKQWSSFIASCDCAIIECSYPSTAHIGFEIGLILSKVKPVILLHKRNKDPVFINKYSSPRLIKSEYSKSNINEVIDWCLEEVEKSLNRRFTLFISPKIDSFLSKISKKHNLPRSEFIRSLIEKEIKSKSRK